VHHKLLGQHHDSSSSSNSSRHRRHRHAGRSASHAICRLQLQEAALRACSCSRCRGVRCERARQTTEAGSGGKPYSGGVVVSSCFHCLLHHQQSAATVLQQLCVRSANSRAATDHSSSVRLHIPPHALAASSSRACHKGFCRFCRTAVQQTSHSSRFNRSMQDQQVQCAAVARCLAQVQAFYDM
jgi:hypothetical protein